MIFVFFCFFFISAMAALSDDDSASSDEKWWSRRRAERLLKEEEEQQQRRRNSWGGSKPGRSANIERDREFFHQVLMRDYFVEQPVYPAAYFRRRFRMRRELFLRIQQDLLRFHGDTFRQKRDAVGKVGFTPEQKITSALRILAYGSSADRNDEYIRMGESTTLHYLQVFCEAVIDLYGSFYLRKPTAEDLKFILSLHSSKGFPGRLGSLDCMHWQWKNCPTAWAGQYKSGEFFYFLFILFYTNILFLHSALFLFFRNRKRRKAYHYLGSRGGCPALVLALLLWYPGFAE